jgi:hypothetical protein
MVRGKGAAAAAAAPPCSRRRRQQQQQHTPVGHSLLSSLCAAPSGARCACEGLVASTRSPAQAQVRPGQVAAHLLLRQRVRHQHILHHGRARCTWQVQRQLLPRRHVAKGEQLGVRVHVAHQGHEEHLRGEGG